MKRYLIAALKTIVLAESNFNADSMKQDLKKHGLKLLLKHPKVKSRDLEDAFGFIAYYLWDHDESSKYNYQFLVDEWNKAFEDAEFLDVPLEEVVKEYRYWDNGRRVKSPEIENPIIVGNLGSSVNVTLDGSHRIISKVIDGEEGHIKVFLLPLHAFAALEGIYDEVDGDKFWKDKDL